MSEGPPFVYLEYKHSGIVNNEGDTPTTKVRGLLLVPEKGLPTMPVTRLRLVAHSTGLAGQVQTAKVEF